MKRIGNLYDRICSIDNLVLADGLAQRGKAKRWDVIRHNKSRMENLAKIQMILIERAFRTSKYHTFQIKDPKERTIFCLPYYPDRIVQHAVMNILEPVFKSVYTADTYSSIPGKGIHAAVRAVKRALKDVSGTTYCLKLDIRKFYPSVSHDILKSLLRKKFKDNDLLNLLDNIIDSAEGLPIGNYCSQYLANFYLAYFDHWLKESKKVKYYFRYADDMVILSDSKLALHSLLTDIGLYLKSLHLEVKSNHQIFPVDARGIDFVGYVFYHNYTLLRKSIKQNLAKMLVNSPNPESIASYNGWLSHCNSRHLSKKLFNNQKIETKWTLM